MNEKLLLLAAICIEAFGKQHSDNIAAISLRAMMHQMDITIMSDRILLSAHDEDEDIQVKAMIINEKENLRVHCTLLEFDEQWRYVIFDSASAALNFACSVVNNFDLDMEVDEKYEQHRSTVNGVTPEQQKWLDEFSDEDEDAQDAAFEKSLRAKEDAVLEKIDEQVDLVNHHCEWLSKHRKNTALFAFLEGLDIPQHLELYVMGNMLARIRTEVLEEMLKKWNPLVIPHPTERFEMLDALLESVSKSFTSRNPKTLRGISRWLQFLRKK